MAIPASCDLCSLGRHTPYSGLHGSVPAKITRLRRELKSLPARQVLFREGEVPSYACTLYSGWAFRYRMLSEGERHILSFYIPGDYLPLLGPSPGPLPFSVRALTDVELCVFDCEAMARAMMATEAARQDLFGAARDHSAGVERRFTDVARRPALGRLAHLVLDLDSRVTLRGGKSDGAFLFPLRQDHLADALGLTAVHVNRTLAILRKENVIRLERQTLGILDPTRLRQLASEG